MSVTDYVIDHYDDSGKLAAAQLADDAPDFIKTAANITEVIGELGPEHFALVCIEGEDPPQMIKKFSTIDEGNTVLSALYFTHTRNFLPEPAQKVAATNLAFALREQGFNVPPDIRDLADDGPINPVVDLRRYHQMEQVKEASVSFEKVAAAVADFNSGMTQEYHPLEQRRIAEQLALHAMDLGIEMPPKLAAFASQDYGSMVERLVRVRYTHLEDPDDADLYEMVLDKRASLDPDTFMECLSELDAEYGIDRLWGRLVPDPVTTTLTKTAADLADIAESKREDEGEILQVGDKVDDFISEATLKYLVNNRYDLLVKQFGEDFATKLRKNPVVVFKSLPTPHKMLVARMAGGERDLG